MTDFAATAGLAAYACVVVAAICDVRRFEIPDGLSIAIAALFVPYMLMQPAAGSLPHLLTGLAVFAAGIALFAAGWMGGGDVKLLAACALWAGPGGLPELLGGMAVSGGVLAAAALAGRRIVGGVHSYPALQRGGPVPYAVAILGGATVLLLSAG